MNANPNEPGDHKPDADCDPKPAIRCYSPRCEHSVPFLWPFAAAIELGEQGMKLFERNLGFLSEAQRLAAPSAPEWASANSILLDMDTMRLRDFGTKKATIFRF